MRRWARGKRPPFLGNAIRLEQPLASPPVHPPLSPAMAKRNLILIHRGPEYVDDFKEIAQKVRALDKSIDVYSIPHESAAQWASLVWMWPTLVVALMSQFRLQVKRGTVLRNFEIEKLAQYEMFRKAGIRTPPTLPFSFGMALDPMLF